MELFSFWDMTGGLLEHVTADYRILDVVTLDKLQAFIFLHYTWISFGWKRNKKKLLSTEKDKTQVTGK